MDDRRVRRYAASGFPNVADSPRTIFFGLRTNVQFFASHLGYAQLGTRLKAFSLLFDQVVVEKGVYEANIGEHGSFETVSPGLERPEQLRPARTRRGAPWGISMQRDGSAGPPVAVISTRLIKMYRSQFYSALEDAIKAKVDWIGYADFSPGGLHSAVDDQAGKLTSRWNWDERDLAKDVFPDKPRFLRDKAHQSLNLDLARAVVLGVALAPDGIHAPLLRAKVRRSADVTSQPSGAAALALLLPDIRTASWEDMSAIRKDKGLRYFRDRMRELEAGAESEPLLEESVREAFVSDVQKRMPNWGVTSLWASVNILASTIPGIATIMTGVAAGKDVAATWHERRGWTATLLRARRRLEKRRPKKSAK